MTSDQFVGRTDAVKRLDELLQGQSGAGGRLTVQSVEGPGGIGKTRLFDHALASYDLSRRNFLTMRLSGNEPSAGTAVRAIAALTESARVIGGRLPPGRFPNTAAVLNAFETIRAEAEVEFKKRSAPDNGAQTAFLSALDLAVAAGTALQKAAPFTKKYIDMKGAASVVTVVQEVLPTLTALYEETPWPWERLLSWTGPTALRNAVRTNALRPLADGLISDLAATLAGYRGSDWFKPMPSKLPGADRLLIVLDDYEKLQDGIGEFLLGHFLPALATANFDSTVVILGRDQLLNTNTAWGRQFGQHMLPAIRLVPLSRVETDSLAELSGVSSPEERERLWQDTQGYPYSIHLWTEEVGTGGRSAVMLKRFFDRTTQWMTDEQRRWLNHTLFLPEVNIRTFGGMLGNEDDAKTAFKWFQGEGSVRDTESSVFRVREYVRSRLLDYLRITDPDQYEALERRAREVAGPGTHDGT